jgi:hypothetical protein
MSEEQPTFKVTDRRLFNPDGSPRDLPPEVKDDATVAPETAAPAEATQAESRPETEASARANEAPGEGAPTRSGWSS